MFEQAPLWSSAYTLRTVLTALFEGTPDRATAQTRLQRWSEQVKAAGLTCFDTFLNTFAHWQEGILTIVFGIAIAVNFRI
ncbi:MAG: transposase [Candidatus Competibacteraceae bacterium]|nr:transposase [Candidatus Competibacteraceae bacterium]